MFIFLGISLTILLGFIIAGLLVIVDLMCKRTKK